MARHPGVEFLPQVLMIEARPLSGPVSLPRQPAIQRAVAPDSPLEEVCVPSATARKLRAPKEELSIQITKAGTQPARDPTPPTATTEELIDELHQLGDLAGELAARQRAGQPLTLGRPEVALIQEELRRLREHLERSSAQPREF
jgi:hypothetical protein